MTAWDDVREGDLVRVTNGETSGTGRVFMGAIIDSLHLSLVDDSNGLMRYMKDEGYTLEIIEKATVSLPTEAGIYTDREGSIWQTHWPRACARPPCAGRPIR